MEINISKNSNKRPHICKIDYGFASELTIANYPGESIRVSGTFFPIRYSSAELVETEAINGEPVEQEFTMEIKGDDPDSARIIKDMVSRYIILKLTYSNGDIKIVGTDESPVMLSLEKSGIPLSNTVTVSRFSAEKAKYLLP